jgi:hypothetical protein
MRRKLLIGALALFVIGGGAYGWSRMHARDYA